MRPVSSLRSAFTLYFTVAAVVPLLIFGYLGDKYLMQRHLAQVGDELSLHTLDIGREIQSLLDQMQDDLRLARDLCAGSGADEPGRLDAMLRDIVRNSTEMLSIYLLDERKRVTHFGLAEIFADQEDDYRGLDLSAQEFFFAVPRDDHGHGAQGKWSEVFVSQTTGDPAISLALPFGNRTLLGTVSLEQLGAALVNRLSQREGLEFSVVDHHGTLVAHSSPVLVRQRTNVAMIHPEVAEAIASGRELTLQVHEDGTRLESLRVLSLPRWVVHASVQRDLAMKPLWHVRRLLLLIVAGSMLFSLMLAVWLSRRISLPLLNLCATAEALSADAYQETPIVKGVQFHEVDSLSNAFQFMAEAVRQREGTLRESEERFRSLVEGMGEGLAIIDANGRVAEANPAAERILRTELSQLLGAGMVPPQWQVIGDDGSPVPPEGHPAAVTLRQGVSINNQVIGMRHRDGREVWLQVNSRPVHDDHGMVDQALLTFADVSGLKIAEESLRLSKLRFQELYQQFTALLEGITDRIVLISDDYRLEWSNQEPGGIDPEAVSASNCCYAQFFNRLEPCPGCPAERAFATAEPAFGEMTDARGRVWNLKAFPVFGTAGQVRNVVMIAEDATDKHASERQRFRAAQLAALGELAAGVAHEINNPISGVINYAQLLLARAAEGSRERDLAQRIIKEGDRIAVIVRELLTFAREESDETRVVSLREALAEALSLCEAQLRKEGVDLRIDMPADLPPVKSRSHQVQQLLLNLISNSRHALAEKFPQAHPAKLLWISGRSIEMAGRPGIRLQVRDHGAGIPPELLEKVMNPFVTTKPAGVGTGLGLSISFDIVKKHEGTLTIASEHGGWTEVTVDLPVFTAGESLASVPSARQPPGPTIA